MRGKGAAVDCDDRAVARTREGVAIEAEGDCAIHGEITIDIPTKVIVAVGHILPSVETCSAMFQPSALSSRRDHGVRRQCCRGQGGRQQAQAEQCGKKSSLHLDSSSFQGCYAAVVLPVVAASEPDAGAAVMAEWVPVCNLRILYDYFTVSTEAFLLPILTPEMGDPFSPCFPSEAYTVSGPSGWTPEAFSWPRKWGFHRIHRNIQVFRNLPGGQPRAASMQTANSVVVRSSATSCPVTGL